ncbi:MAG: CCA tRNA nucleotidyltransferase [Anaerolineae bacterium]
MVGWCAEEALKKICRFLTERSIEAYLVGGCVRDRLLGRQSRDIDFVVQADAAALAREMADWLRGSFVLLNDVHGTGRVVLHDAAGEHVFFDFTWLRGGGLAADLALRDFTINAIAVDIAHIFEESLPLIDPYGGQRDLAERRIRVISEAVFRDDPLRMVRAIRFASELGFSLDPLTDVLLRRDHLLIKRVSRERVRDELVHILVLPHGADGLMELDSAGLLPTIIPELRTLKRMEQPPPHYLDVFQHSLETVRELEGVIGALERGGDRALAPLAPFAPQLLAHLQTPLAGERPRSVLLKLAALLHDVGKPAARELTPQGRVRFFDHDKGGAGRAAAIAQRLRFGGREVGVVKTIVRHHMRPLLLARRERVTPRAIYRFFRDTHETGVDILLLALADARATHGPYLEAEEWERLVNLVRLMLAKYYEEREVAIAPPKLIDGDDLMAEFGLKSGPRIGELLEAVREAQVQGEVRTREEALAYVAELLAG